MNPDLQGPDIISFQGCASRKCLRTYVPEGPTGRGQGPEPENEARRGEGFRIPTKHSLHGDLRGLFARLDAERIGGTWLD